MRRHTTTQNNTKKGNYPCQNCTADVAQMVKISQSDKEVVRVEVPDIVPVSKKEVTNLQTMVEAVVSGKADEDTVVSLRKQLKDWLERESSYW